MADIRKSALIMQSPTRGILASSLQNLSEAVVYLPCTPKEDITVYSLKLNTPQEWTSTTEPPPKTLGDNLVEVVTEVKKGYVFYCDSIPWDGNSHTTDQTGDGIQEKPWRNLEFALTQLRCLLRFLVCTDTYIVLRITGTVDYSIDQKEFDGQGRVILDYTDCKCTTDVIYSHNRHPSMGAFGIRNVNVYNLVWEPTVTQDDPYVYPWDDDFCSTLYNMRVPDTYASNIRFSQDINTHYAINCSIDTFSIKESYDRLKIRHRSTDGITGASFNCKAAEFFNGGYAYLCTAYRFNQCERVSRCTALPTIFDEISYVQYAYQSSFAHLDGSVTGYIGYAYNCNAVCYSHFNCYGCTATYDENLMNYISYHTFSYGNFYFCKAYVKSGYDSVFSYGFDYAMVAEHCEVYIYCNEDNKTGYGSDVCGFYNCENLKDCSATIHYDVNVTVANNAFLGRGHAFYIGLYRQAELVRCVANFEAKITVADGVDIDSISKIQIDMRAFYGDGDYVLTDCQGEDKELCLGRKC